MAKSANQKLKLLYLYQIFKRETDENNKLSLAEITARLMTYSVSVERKTLYDDFEALRIFGLDVVCTREKGKTLYFAPSQSFEIPELRLIIDAVQASRSLTAKKTSELIEKLKALSSTHEAAQLSRVVFSAHRPKAENESIYYSIGDLHTAIETGKQVKFNYFDWNEKKQRVFRHDNADYMVSPFALAWDDEHYYMLGYDSVAQIVKHYRVDRMANVKITKFARLGQNLLEKFKPDEYTKKMFGMFGGDEEAVTLRFEKRLSGAMLDRFGMDIAMLKANECTAEITIKAVCSPQFYAWVFGFEGAVKITSPPNVINEYKQMCFNAINSLL